ncbi:MAG: polyisoprenoid-binding protein YceI, partial [Ulvibacter sp.]
LRNKYFKSDDFPLLKFKSDSISAEGDSFIVNGVLTIKGISKIVSFRFSKTSNLLTGKASMNASDFDINIHDETSRNKLTITIVLPYSN